MGMNPADAEATGAAAISQQVLDRMLIHDLFTRYYSGLGGGDYDWFGAFFTEGAELDVNGVVARGREEIADVYRRIAQDKPKLIGQFRMILSNELIEVNGDRATARMMWTQTLNETLKGQPRLIEQGLETDELIKQDGAWKITKRVVTADSNLPDMMDETYVAHSA